MLYYKWEVEGQSFRVANNEEFDDSKVMSMAKFEEIKALIGDMIDFEFVKTPQK